MGLYSGINCAEGFYNKCNVACYCNQYRGPSLLEASTQWDITLLLIDTPCTYGKAPVVSSGTFRNLFFLESLAALSLICLSGKSIY